MQRDDAAIGEVEAPGGDDRREPRFNLARSEGAGSIPPPTVPSGSLAKPAFIGLGAQKGGTTWLYRQLEIHPGIRFSTRGASAGRIANKELHFWCRAMHHRESLPSDWPSREELERYRASFPDGAVTGEITPHYALLDDAGVSRVAEFLPAIRLVYLLREPRARAWSAAVSAYAELAARKHGAPQSRSARVWDAPVTREISHFDAGAEDWLCKRVAQPGVVAHSDYAANVSRWLRHFPAESMLLVTTDDMAADARGLMRRVYRHVGADPGFADSISDEELGAWVNPHRPAPRVPPAIQAVLDETYLPLLEPLERLTGWDLTCWKGRPVEFGE